MRLLHNYPGTDTRQQALAALPLPEAAVVIDVRDDDYADSPLLAYLATELEDLAMEMQRQHIPTWERLADCIDMFSLEAMSASKIPDANADFKITRCSGEQLSLSGRENLARHLGRYVVDYLRNQRLSVTDGSSSAANGTAEMLAVRRSTVRVFFLTDMQEPQSLTRAATYAHWLQEWNQHEQGARRHHRDPRLHTIIVGMHADAATYPAVLLDTLGRLPDSAIDTVFLMQKYSDNEEYIGDDTQVYQVELLLSTLLLHWPEVFLKKIDDPLASLVHFTPGARTLPWPTFTVGLAALQYSARWATRWLNAAVTATLLETLTDATKLEQEQGLLERDIQKWLDAWWHELCTIVPGSFLLDIEELSTFTRLQQLTRAPRIADSAPPTMLEHLEKLRLAISACYTGPGPETLQRSLDKGPLSILHQFRRTDGPQTQAMPSYDALADLDARATHFLPAHFQAASGSFPRAQRQLSALTKAIGIIREAEWRAPDLQAYREQFEQQVQDTRATLARRLQSWRLPFVGTILRSTFISLLIALTIGMLLLFGVAWQPVLAAMARVPALSHVRPDVLAWSLRAALTLLLACCEWLYLARCKRALQRAGQRVEQELRQTVAAHMAQVGTVIAARVALALLQHADLYAPTGKLSPYEQRLSAMEQTLTQARQQALSQQQQAGARFSSVPHHHLGKSVWTWDKPFPAVRKRDETLDWRKVQEAFLQSCQELRSNAVPFNLLAEMLLRRLGPETPVALLEDMLTKQRWIEGTGEEARYQALSTLLVTVVLSLHIAGKELIDVLPLLPRYSALQALYLEEPALPTAETLDLPAIITNASLQQARGGNIAPSTRAQDQLLIRAALASWIGQQHQHSPQLAEVFASGDVIAHALAERVQPSQALVALCRQGILSAYPDEIAGEDFTTLLLAPGPAGAAFMRATDPLQLAQVHVAYFPDWEKLIYLHLHRMRQLIPACAPGKASATRES